MEAFNVKLLMNSQLKTVMTTRFGLSSLADKLFPDA